MWTVFDDWNNFFYLPAHEIVNALGPDRCVALPMFRAFTGWGKLIQDIVLVIRIARKKAHATGKRSVGRICKHFSTRNQCFCQTVTTMKIIDIYTYWKYSSVA